MTDTNKPWFYYYAVNMCTRQSLSAIARGGREMLDLCLLPPFLSANPSLLRNSTRDKNENDKIVLQILYFLNHFYFYRLRIKHHLILFDEILIFHKLIKTSE